jgi:group II intron reverse transcriptase/maturase
VSPPFVGNKHFRDKLVTLKLMNSFTIAVYYTVPHTQTVTVCVSRSPVIVCALGLAKSAVTIPPQGIMMPSMAMLLRATIANVYENSQNSGSPVVGNNYGDRESVVGVTLRSRPRLSVTGMKSVSRAFSTDSFEPPKGFSKILEDGSPLIKPLGRGGKSSFSALECSKLIHAISHPSVLLLAYESIKSKPGNMTKGTTPETLDGMTMKWILATSKSLLAGKYKFGVARRIMIPKIDKPGKPSKLSKPSKPGKPGKPSKLTKPGKQGKLSKPGKRPITIGSPREKVVQKAIQLVLTELFEPTFLDTSHGFRPGRSCLTALKMVDQHFRNGKWVIEADLTKCFERIPHVTLLAVLRQTIKCTKTLALIKSGLKAGYIHVGKLVSGELMGIPQGSILSPLLSNIYLHSLDMFMESIIKERTVGKQRRKNPAYGKLQGELERNKLDPSACKMIRRKMWKVDSKDLMDPNFIRVKYVRYADNFVVSFIAPHSVAREVRDQLRIFLKDQLGMELNELKTTITDFHKGIKFLGAVITNRRLSEKPVRLALRGKSKGTKVRVTPRLSFHAPIRTLLDRLVIRGYFRWSKVFKRIVPTGMRSLVNLDHRAILLLYNSVISGLMNYYRFADNRKSLGNITHGLKMSCALTLALKFKMRTARKSFRRFGGRLKDPLSKVHLKIPETHRRLSHLERFKTGKGDLKTPESVIKLSYANIRSVSMVNRTCVVCGSSSGIQAHHVRKLRELNRRLHLDFFTKQMAGVNRKQIPLCVEHHRGLHKGILSESERKAYSEGVRAL